MDELKALELLYVACRQLPTVANDHDRLREAKNVLMGSLGELESRRKEEMEKKPDGKKG